MKGKSLIGISLLILVFTLTGCSSSNGNLAHDQVNIGCGLFTSDYVSGGYKTPEASLQYFALAARLDPGYIPLAQAARYTSNDFDTAMSSNFVAQWRDAVNLIWGVCSGA